MADYDSADLLRRCKKLARRPASDLSFDDIDWYDALTVGQAEVNTEIVSLAPEAQYGAPTLLTTADSGATFQFGLDADGDPIFPIGHCEIYPSLLHIPDEPMEPVVDFLLEGTQIRMRGLGSFPDGAPYARFVSDPTRIDATHPPTLHPKTSRIGAVYAALEQWASRPGSGANPKYWADKKNEAIKLAVRTYRTQYNMQAASGYPIDSYVRYRSGGVSGAAVTAGAGGGGGGGGGGGITPPAGAVWRAHEPALMTQITDQPFTSLASNGWFIGGSPTLANDSTGPKSPNGAFENFYPGGMVGGINPGLVELDFASYRTLYACLWVKHSANFQGHGSGVNKIMHVWIGAVNHLFINCEFYGASDTVLAGVRLQGIVAGGNFDAGTAGVFTSTEEMPRDQWHLIELLVTANTGSATDGSFSLYVDGVLAKEVHNLEYETGGPLINVVKLDPTWGGSGDSIVDPAGQTLRVDHIYMSGSN